jgi:DNA polymerase I
MKGWLLDVNYRNIKSRKKNTPDITNMEKILWSEEEQRFFIYHESEKNRHYPYAYVGNNDFQIPKEALESKKLYMTSRENKYHPILKETYSIKKFSFRDPLSVARYCKDDDQAYENHHRYTIRWGIDTGHYYGMPYIVVGDQLHDLTQKDETTTRIEDIKEKMKPTGIDPKITEGLTPLLFAPVPELPAFAFDVECLTRGPVKPSADLALEPIISIALLFTHPQEVLSSKTGVVLLLDEKVRGNKRHSKEKNEHMIYFVKNKDTIKLEWFGKEKDLVRRFFDIIDNCMSALMVTFAGDFFDCKYLMNRINILGLTEYNYRFVVKGNKKEVHYVPQKDYKLDLQKFKVHLDLQLFFSLPFIQGYAFSNAYKRKSLNAISKALINEEKTEEDASKINGMLLFELAHYNMEDARLTLKLLTHQNWIVLRLMFYFSRLGFETLLESCRRGITDKIGNLFLWRAYHRNWLMFRGDEVQREEAVVESKTDKQFRGSDVIEPISGIHFKTHCYDFTGLYTNIVHKKNVSPETMNCNHEECKKNIVPQVGHHICTKVVGLASEMVGFITNVRALYFKPLGKKDPIMKIIEQSLKVLGNAPWGFLSTEDSSWFSIPSAESITAHARTSLQRVVLEARRLGMTVIYGDTDSAFVTDFTTGTITQLLDFSQKQLDLNLEYEKGGTMILSTRKKNYILIHDDKEVEIKGMTGKKSNTSPVVSTAFTYVTNALKEIEDLESAERVMKQIRSLIRATVKKIKLRHGDIEDYIYNVSITSPVSAYGKTKEDKDGKKRKVTTPQHVRAALLELDELLKYVPEEDAHIINKDEMIPAGKIQPFIKANTNLNSYGSNALPPVLADLKYLDTKKYLEELRTAMIQITDPFEMDIDDIIAGHKQKGVMDFL